MLPDKGFRVTLSENNILNGNRSEGASCPIALAVREMFPQCDVDVQNKIAITCGVHQVEYALPDSAVQFIDDFDAGREVAPITFETTRYDWDTTNRWCDWG
jgi:hypothetical protein